MLPSTGYFKGNSCPFYDSGLCERPYCHFRHVKKESTGTAPSDGIESGAMLQKLVSAAVQKVLQQKEVSASTTTTQEPFGEEGDDSNIVNSTQSKATYNPTPIAELNKINSSETDNELVAEQRKRHIPVPYTPRKPASLPVKRPIESCGSSKPVLFIPPTLKYTPGCTESVQLDQYTPKGSIKSGEKYLPGTETELQEYNPKEILISSRHNYVPSDRSVSKKKVLEYKPKNVSNKNKKSVTYQPTPKSLVPCFSSDEDEPDSKKIKLSNDLNGFDDLGPEFDILDQILDEENIVDTSNNETINDDEATKYVDVKVNNQPSKPREHIKKHKKSSHKHNGKKPKQKNYNHSTHKSKEKPPLKGDDKPTHKSNDKPALKSDEKRVLKGDGKPTHKSNDKPALKGDDKQVLKGDDKPPHKSNDKSALKGDDNLTNQSDEKPALKGEDKSTHKSDNKLAPKNYDILESHTIDDKPTYKSDNKPRHKSNEKKSHGKGKSEKKDKSSVHRESNSKSRVVDKKGHKEYSEEKLKDEKKSDNSSNREKHSRSKNRDKSSKHSKSSSSKNSEIHTKHSSRSNSKYISKNKEKNDHQHKSAKDSLKEKYKKGKDKHNTNNNFNDIDSYIHVEDTLFTNKDLELEMSESDEETIALECKRIFEEYVPRENANTDVHDIFNSHHISNSNNDTEYVPGKKRISRTSDKNIKVIPKPQLKPDYKVSAAQTMAERLTKIKEFHFSKSSQSPSINETIVAKQEPVKNLLNAPYMTNAKIRIAHVPYASTMMNAKKVITPIMKLKSEEPSTSSTVIQTVKKGTHRVAHIPNEKFIDRPGVLEPLASKIAANIRSTYLNMMIDECLKIYLSATDAYARAQHEELMTSKKCTTVQIYKNSAVLTVSRLRKEFQECNGVKKSGSDCSTLQKIPQTISGKTNNIGSWSIESKRTFDNSREFTGAKFFKNIQKWVLTEEQLQNNGFPRPHASGEKGRAIIYGQNKQTPPKGLIRTCCRCKKDYIVDKKGFPALEEECIYHPNNKYRVRGEAKYQCCSQDSSTDGCCVAPCHVYEYVDFENLKGFIKTMPPESEMDDYGVFSLDCEMCYTTHGLDLTRVTVINSACKVVYETLIKPLHPIIDYNTRYSGITEEQMANVKTTLLEVQATLLSIFNSKTILVGHSLESDFKALKLIHDTVIDTSILFPHKMGPPFKRALRNLSSEYLKKIIQNSVDGHDSAEDAMVCMELLVYKLKEDLKTR